MRDVEVAVVGAGLAGLACAARLAGAGVEVTVLERSSSAGGRIGTDVIDGFHCDRGFQLVNPAYPEVSRLLDVGALDLRPFPPGLVVAADGRRHVLADPRRLPFTLAPRAAAEAALAPLGSVREKGAFAWWAWRSGTDAADRLLTEPDEPWGQALTRRGINGRLRRGAIEPFLAGVLGERDGSTSHRFVRLLVRSFVRGRPSVPAIGMRAVPDQLAARLPAGVLRLSTPVAALTDHGITTGDGALAARAVVIATEPAAFTHLTGRSAPGSRGLTTFWHTADQPPTTSAALHVDAEGDGPVVNTVVISNAAPEYAPAGRVLIATTVLGGDGGADVERAARAQAGRIYGADAGTWQLITTHALPQALTAMPPPLDPRLPVRIGQARFVAGDHRDTASQQGALVSGRRAADAVLDLLGRPIPPRLPLGAHADG